MDAQYETIMSRHYCNTGYKKYGMKCLIVVCTEPLTYEPVHDKTYNKTCVTSKDCTYT